MYKKWIVFPIVLILLIASVFGFLLLQNQKNIPSEGARKIIEAMFDIPNSDLYDAEALKVLWDTEYATLTAEQKAIIEAATEHNRKSWEAAVGKYFNGNGFLSFYPGVRPTYFHIKSGIDGQKIEFKNMVLLAKEPIERVAVVVSIDGTEQLLEFTFLHETTDGSIRQVFFWGLERTSNP